MANIERYLYTRMLHLLHGQLAESPIFAASAVEVPGVDHDGKGVRGRRTAKSALSAARLADFHHRTGFTGSVVRH